MNVKDYLWREIPSSDYESFHYFETLLDEISSFFEVRRFLQKGIADMGLHHPERAYLRMEIILTAWQYECKEHISAERDSKDTHRSKSIRQTMKSCFFTQGWLFKLYFLLKQNHFEISKTVCAMAKSAAVDILHFGERDANNRSFFFALGHAYAALVFPELPQAAEWMSYAQAVWNDWYESGDCYEPGYVAHNIAQVIELGRILGKTACFSEPRIKKIFRRYLDQISPSGLAVAPGDGDDQSAYLEALENMYAVTGDKDFLWALRMAEAAGEYGGYRDKQFGRICSPQEVSENKLASHKGCTQIQLLYPEKAAIPDRILLNPSRKLGNPYLGMLINDRYETLHHASEDNRGEIYHYEVDGVLLLKRSTWSKWAEQTNTVILRDASCEYPFSYSQGLFKDHWYLASANLRLFEHFTEDERYVRSMKSSKDFHAKPAFECSEPDDMPLPLQYVDQTSPYGLFLSNPRGFKNENQTITLENFCLSFHTLPRDYWTSDQYEKFQRAMTWNRDEHRRVVYTDCETDVEIKDLCIAGKSGKFSLSERFRWDADVELIHYTLQGEKRRLTADETKQYISCEKSNGSLYLKVHCPFGRLDVLIHCRPLTFHLRDEYTRFEFYYRYLTEVSNYLRTPIKLMINRITLRSLHIDFQQGGILRSADAQQKENDCYGRVDYDMVYTSDTSWTRKTILTQEGYLVVVDELTPGPKADGMAAGPVWQLPCAPERGLQWADVTVDAKLSKKLLVYFHPQRGHVYATQFQPKIWVRHEHAFYDKTILKSGKKETFLTVFVPHDQNTTAMQLCHKHNEGGILEPADKDQAVAGVFVEARESCDGITTKWTADGSAVVQLFPCICGDYLMSIIFTSDGRWRVERTKCASPFASKDSCEPTTE